MDTSHPDLPQGPSADVRHATIVRCDIVGSTRIRSNLDIEGQYEFNKTWQAVALRAAQAYGGYVSGFEGDGAMIVFGHPEPREDMAEQAIGMGLELVRDVQRQRTLTDQPLDLRVGIATGKIAAVHNPFNAKSEPVAGLTIDIAERLRALAQPGEVVVSDVTKGLAGAFFEYDDLGLVELKGIPEPMRAWRVVGPTSIASRFEAQRSKGGTERVLGRAEELSILARAWRSASEGHGHAVCLMGVAGIGKSRLAKATLTLAAEEDALVLEMDCTPSTRYSPFFPVGVLLQRAAGITANTPASEKSPLAAQFLRRVWDAEQAGEKLEDLAPLFGLEDRPVPMHRIPTELRNQTIEAVLHMLQRLAAERPVAILCEDLHWVDDTTATVIERVAQEITGLRVLLIVTYRPDDEPGVVPIKLDGFTRLDLQPLDGAMAADFVRALAAGTIPEDRVDEVVSRGEGVPLVLEELTRTMLSARHDTLRVASGRRDANEAPTEIQLVVESRLARWPRLTHAAQAASVLGREFSLGILDEMSSAQDREQLVDMVRVFTREGIFEPSGDRQDGRLRFKHVMIREAVHDTLLQSERQRLHSAAADTLSAYHAGTPDAAPDVLAEHLEQARRHIESIRMRLAASAATAARGAYVESAGHCTAGLRLVTEIGDDAERRRVHAQLLSELGVAQVGQLGYAAEAVRTTYVAAQEVVGADAEPELLYPIKRALATFNLVRGNLADAHALSLEGVDLANRSKRDDFRIDALSVLSYTTLYFGRLEECRRCIEECLRLYASKEGGKFKYPVPQDAATAAWALLPTAAWLLGDAEGAERAIREGIAHVGRLDRDYDRALLHAWIAGVRYTQRRYEEAKREAEKAKSRAKGRYQEWESIAELMLALASAASTPDEVALATADYLRGLFLAMNIRLNASYYLWGLALGHIRAGKNDRAAALVEEAMIVAEASQETRMQSELLMLKAQLESSQDRAIETLADALAVAERQGALATALRAAAAKALRDGTDHDKVTLAQKAVKLLDGDSPYPSSGDWMRELLDALRGDGGTVSARPSPLPRGPAVASY